MCCSAEMCNIKLEPYEALLYLIFSYILLNTLTNRFIIDALAEFDFIVGIERKRDDANCKVIRSESCRVDERFYEFHLLLELRARLTDGRVQNKQDVCWHWLARADH